MEFNALFQGILVGIAIAFPKGPAGLLVINQTVLFGIQKGFATAKGPILTTFISCGIVLLLQVFGISFEAIRQIRHDLIIHVIGGFFLLSVGLYVTFFLKEQNVTSQKLFFYTFLEPFLFPATVGTFLWISPDIFTETISNKSLFFMGIMSGTFLWYGCSCKFFDWLSQRGFKKIIGFVTIFFGSIFIVIGMCAILIANHRAIFIF